MSSDSNIGQPPAAGGGEAPAQGGGRGLSAPQAARTAGRLATWFAIRAIFVVTLLLGVFYGIELLIGAAENGLFDSELGQLFAYALWLVGATLWVWLIIAIVRFFVSATNGFRAGMKGEDTE